MIVILLTSIYCVSVPTVILWTNNFYSISRQQTWIAISKQNLQTQIIDTYLKVKLEFYEQLHTGRALNCNIKLFYNIYSLTFHYDADLSTTGKFIEIIIKKYVMNFFFYNLSLYEHWWCSTLLFYNPLDNKTSLGDSIYHKT